MMCRIARWTALPFAAMALLACSDDDATGLAPVPVTREVVVNSTTTAYVALGDAPTQVAVADPATSTAWDLAITTTTVITNRAAGMGVYCLCANENATTAQLRAMTAANQLAAFEAVTAAQIPPPSAFQPDVFAPAASGWYTGTGTAAVAAPATTILVRRGTPTVTFVKFRVTTVTAPGTSGPASIGITYAVQPAPGAPFGPDRTATIPNGTYFDFSVGGVGSAAAWDIRLDGWHIRTNGGISGPGSVSALPTESPYASLVAQAVAEIPPQTFRRDGMSSVFGTRPWYRYNITGTDMQIWPVFNVYLVRRGASTWKVQLAGYYNAAGEPRFVTIRSARLQ